MAASMNVIATVFTCQLLQFQSYDQFTIAGSITFGDVLTVSPFNNPIDLIEITGQTLKDVFEHSVSKQQKNGGFLQISGLLPALNRFLSY